MSGRRQRGAGIQPKAGRPFMPGDGAPDNERKLLRWSWARERLEKSHNYWISTTRPDGSPHTMVIWGLWLQGCFYFSTGRQSRKARNLLQNPRCVICTEDADEAVIVEGTARELPKSALLRKIVKDYEKKYDWDMSEYSQEPMFEIRPRVAFGFFEKEFLESATRWQFPVSATRSTRAKRAAG
jgi:nitroimidazol reductase NimA-like FMN-containing flavoprotein (pyridoxamine 5'-phosphate oxidase superfamily)